MLTVYLIDAYESTYCGLHGIHKRFIDTFYSDIDAEQAAEEASLDVIGSYSCCHKDFEEEARDMGLKPDTEAWEEYIGERETENSAYEISVLSITPEEYNANRTKYDEELFNSIEKFKDKYEIATL